jgi:dTMP kinase
MNWRTGAARQRSQGDKTGFFLSLDGPDGSGKTTQARRLEAWLRGIGREVLLCRDPGGTALGERLRALLLDHHEGDLAIGLRAEMLLYMTSRAELVDEVIAPALAEGKVVISDRYLLANVVYQGYAGGLDVEEVWQVGRAATGGLLPDLTLVLDVPPDVADSRLGVPRDRMEARPAAFRRKVRSGFLKALASYPAPILLIDATADADAVEAKIRGEVARVLGIGSRA